MKFKVVNIKARKKPNMVKVMNCQLKIDKVNFDVKGAADFTKNLAVTNKQLTAILANAKKKKPHLLVFPELSIPESKIAALKEFSLTNNCIIVAGSYYKKDPNGYSVNTSPIIINGEIFYSEKVYLSPAEQPANANIKIKGGEHILVFKNTQIGNFAVLICNDFLNPDVRNECRKYDLDLLIIVSLQRKSELYHDHLQNYVFEWEEGIYCIYSNCLSSSKKAPADGWCAVFGHLDRMYNDDLLQDNVTDFIPSHKIAELKKEALYLLFEINIARKKPFISRNHQSEPNFKFIEKYSLTANKTMVDSPKKPSHITKYKNFILEMCRIIDFAGLPEDDTMPLKKYYLDQLYISLNMSHESGYTNDTESAAKEEYPWEFGFSYKEQYKNFEKNFRKRENREHNFLHNKKLGDFLKLNKRLIILGDPGSGKTILTQWLSTSYSLRKKSFKNTSFPDVETLPDIDLLPIIVRCRDYKDKKLRILVSGLLKDIVKNSVHLEQFSDKEFDEFSAELEERLDSGKVLLIIDGLDEIESAESRRAFCIKLQKLSAQYPNCYFVATTRIKGYTELNSYVGNGFVHIKVEDLDEKDKVTFAKKWCEATLPAFKRKEAEAELIKSINLPSITHITNNPLLLTNTCLLKRTQAVLPERKNEVYQESIKLLFNRRPLEKDRIDFNVGSAQLMYIAYEMCERGISQLRKKELTAILDEFRSKFDTMAFTEYSPREFILIIEKQTGLFIEKGREKFNGIDEEIYEFKHKTFQEYFAGLSLVEYRYKNYDSRETFDSKILSLVSETENISTSILGRKRDYVIVKEVWHEPLKFAITSSTWRQTEEAFRSMIFYDEKSLDKKIVKARIVMACECLAENPLQLSRQLAEKTILQFINLVEEYDASNLDINTAYDHALKMISLSKWNADFKRIILSELNTSEFDLNKGRIYLSLIREEELDPAFLSDDIKSFSAEDIANYCLKCVELFYEYHNSSRISLEADLISQSKCISKLWKITAMNNHLLKSCALWALAWCTNANYKGDGLWKPKSTDYKKISSLLHERNGDFDTKMLVNLLTKRYLDFEYEEDYVYEWAVRADTGNKVKELAVVKDNPLISDEVKESLLNLLKNTKSKIFKKAIVIRLSEIGILREEFSDILIQMLEDPCESRENQRTARLVLGLKCSDKALPNLVKCLTSDDEETVDSALLAIIGQNNPDSAKYLIKILQNGNVSAIGRKYAALILGTLNVTKQIINALEKAAAEDTAESVRKTAETSIKWLLI